MLFVVIFIILILFNQLSFAQQFAYKFKNIYMNQEIVQFLKDQNFVKMPFKYLEALFQQFQRQKKQKEELGVQSYYLLGYFLVMLMRANNNCSKEEKEKIGKYLHKIGEINQRIVGTYLCFYLNQRFIQFTIEMKQLIIDHRICSNILELLKDWIKQIEDIGVMRKQKEKINLFERIWKLIAKKNTYNQVEDNILFINYIYKDIITFLPSFIKSDQEIKKELEAVDLNELVYIVIFLDLVFPKSMFNVLLEQQFLPQEIISYECPEKRKYQFIYVIENFQTVIRNSQNFEALIEILIRVCLKYVKSLQPKYQQMVLEITFRYYYMYYSLERAEEFVIECLRGLQSMVIFASSKDIMIFLGIVEGIQREKFVEKILENFSEIKTMKVRSHVQANHKNDLVPFSANGMELWVKSGEKTLRYLEVFRQFSLIYFDIMCKGADINIKFAYLGDFTDKLQIEKEVFKKDKLKMGENFKGSIVVLNTGIYCFEFDNQYSWIINKTIIFRCNVLATMDVKHENWVEYLKLMNSRIYDKEKKCLRVKQEYINGGSPRKDLTKNIQQNKKNKSASIDYSNIKIQIKVCKELLYLRIENQQQNAEFEYELEIEHGDNYDKKEYSSNIEFNNKNYSKNKQQNHLEWKQLQPYWKKVYEKVKEYFVKRDMESVIKDYPQVNLIWFGEKAQKIKLKDYLPIEDIFLKKQKYQKTKHQVQQQYMKQKLETKIDQIKVQVQVQIPPCISSQSPKLSLCHLTSKQQQTVLTEKQI